MALLFYKQEGPGIETRLLAFLQVVPWVRKHRIGGIQGQRADDSKLREACLIICVDVVYLFHFLR